MITCDWDNSIFSVVKGCPGAAPDAFVQSRAAWHKHPTAYFSEVKCLFGDMGMKYSRWVLWQYWPHVGGRPRHAELRETAGQSSI